MALVGRKDRMRLSVFRSGKHIYAQIIDDVLRKTIASASDVKLPKGKIKGGVLSATKVGEMIAVAAFAKKVTQVVFDRGGYRYHGRVEALADAARKAGLKF